MKKFSERIILFIKNETVLVISWILAIVSAFFVPPAKEYLSYIDFRTLGLLLSLMFVTAGLQSCHVFEKMGNVLLARTKGIKGLKFVLIFLCFFGGMIITNDVALITFVPFAIYVLKKAGREKEIGIMVVFQTVAANLGSMMTPFGNPQNLYLFSESGMSGMDFFKNTIPYTLVAAILLCVFCFAGKRGDFLEVKKEEKVTIKKGKTFLYVILFVLCILAVFKVIPYYAALLVVLVAAFFMDKSLYLKVDYSLILTFVGFFIFIGNVGKSERISDFLSHIIGGREIAVSILSSQIISNVPAALLLSGFTDEYGKLLVGLNIGGLGTLIASMASLISYKIYVREYPGEKGRYIGKFSLISVIFLIPMCVTAWVLTK